MNVIRILIDGYYGYRKLGDEAILMSILSDIRGKKGC